MLSPQWSSELESGNERIDAQHRRLFDLIRELNEGLQQKDAERAALASLTKIASYVLTHFQDEELFMRREGYADLAAHQREHRAFTTKVQGLIENVRLKKRLPPQDVARLLNDWLRNHIKGSDLKMISGLRSSRRDCSSRF